jgi:mevalonate kinase
MKVLAPGKLILSGEHAVVYGQPALAMAVNRYATATVSREGLSQVLLDLADIAHHSRLSVRGLLDLKSRIKKKYHRFIRGEYSIRDVLHKPFELAQFALGAFAESLNISLPHGVRIHVQSDIPIGCGMGSSAATILSVIHAVSTYLQVTISADTLFQLALEAENMQHGRSSGLDLRVVQQGGCLYMHGAQLESRSVPLLTMYLINTGTPSTTTGQCVETAAVHFKSQSLCDEFGAVTRHIDQALKLGQWQNMQEGLQHNQHLLTAIGVVPDTVQQFVTQVEKAGGVAKVCGAGAIMGEKAGAVLVLMQEAAPLSEICSRFNYECMPIAGDARGVHVV